MFDIFYNKKFRSIASQFTLILFLVVVFYYFINNAIINLDRLGITSGFDFLFSRAGYDAYSPFFKFTSDSLHIDAYFVGLLNTLSVSILGIFIATILGFIMGVLRLSNNWLVSKLVYLVVEFKRNVPVLIWIIIWYFGVFLQLPSAKKAININDSIFISNRGLYFPSPVFSEGAIAILIAFIGAIIINFFYVKRAKKIHIKTGKQSPIFLVSLLLIIGLPVVTYFVTNQPIEWVIPELKGFNFKGGMALKPEFVALLMGLAVYTSAHIAEIVRAGILSVPKGQIEAGMSFNITRNQMMKMVVIPQALRLIIPPLTSQYLNLMKNSSLAVAVGYMDLTATTGGITLNQTGQAIECILMIMGTYLLLSLLISAIMNYVNKKVQLVER
ncbi:MAG: amino acid ABC transporter permease [Alphaproteobacteria bacterium]|jgi:general L-amino acid transport system permease protein